MSDETHSVANHLCCINNDLQVINHVLYLIGADGMNAESRNALVQIGQAAVQRLAQAARTRQSQGD